MAVYSFKCVACGHRTDEQRGMGESSSPVCMCGERMERDWHREWKSQSTHIPLHMSSRNTSQKSDFLPSTKDFESPTDPTGEKGMKEWKDTHTRVGFREV